MFIWFFVFVRLARANQPFFDHKRIKIRRVNKLFFPAYFLSELRKKIGDWVKRSDTLFCKLFFKFWRERSERKKKFVWLKSVDPKERFSFIIERERKRIKSENKKNLFLKNRLDFLLNISKLWLIKNEVVFEKDYKNSYLNVSS